MIGESTYFEEEGENMADLLVRLYDQTFTDPVFSRLNDEGIIIKRALAPEKQAVVDWVAGQFGKGWASECGCSFAAPPIPCYIAVFQNKIIGFACYETTWKCFFGPTGVDPAYRGKGIGKALLLKCLEGLRDLGYAYAIIGSAGPADFYVKTCGATVIENSSPGIYRDMFRG